MNTHHQIQVAIRTLSSAFAPLACHILAARKGSFSFTVVDHTGVAQHSQRLYPGQYSGDSLQNVIERTRQSLAL
ncbi:hypothetical protein [Phytopseudomonas dryadis]|uniref:Uncharacterized protein n=1 Tax=Phytopseudomonas dryadis TaxID=2487520 RepID=A0A4Q9QTA1_9GAMM|nr:MULTISPECIES: hypothetical protein [Pseudomonas]TBU86204.1 hypothetical protein DNK44_23800 [Pseudomonas dryadis]TBV01497.1 hypothetical protein DNK34_20880 [Pseudomonas dryadis]TBV19430.1 hypothetical protein DNK41_02525 [Pseudomonas sp. FRB 230]